MTITGIEVELVVPDGPLEAIFANRYAGFLGAPTAAVCTLAVEPKDELEACSGPLTALVKRIGTTRFEVTHAMFSGFFELRGRGSIHSGIAPGSIDEALRTLFALLALSHDGLLLRATGLIERGWAHLFVGVGAATLGDGPSLAPPGGYVVIRRVAEVWVAGSTPFQKSTDDTGLPREAKLARLCGPMLADRHPHTGEQLVRLLKENVVLPTSDDETRRAVHELSIALAASVSHPAEVIWQ